ncbi:hypothetical protein EM6_0492 [Asticcacaulis excentricus]|uniref:Uncharacterized protein n=1 Tax=Asticcacaulis excentricus TaxID=78587 RepID=A0A3G9G240_9CAUL|nr:hypothetical protein EM6_0492 [Asticcacaulis excentricus]
MNAHTHATGLLGVPADQVMRLPKDGDAEGWAKFNERIADQFYANARPAAADAYEFNGVDLSNPIDKAFIEDFRGTAFENGVSQKQMDGFMKWFGEANERINAQIIEQTKTERAANQAALDQAWGEKAQVYKTEIPNVVAKLAEKAGLFDPQNGETAEKVLQALNIEGDAMADNPTLMRLLAVVADMTAEPEVLPGTARTIPSGQGAMTPAQAKEALDAFMANKDKTEPFYNPAHQGHAVAKAEWQRLINAMHPSSGG